MAALVADVACGSYSNGGGGGGITIRAFVSNPVHPLSSGGGTPVLEVMDASKDLLSFSPVSLSGFTGTVGDPGMMSLTPDHTRTLVMSPADSKLGIVDNSSASFISSVILPGASDSFFVWTDNKTAYLAIPSASVVGQAAGVVDLVDINAASITAAIPIPSAHYLAESPNGNQILVFSDNTDTVVLLTPSLIGAPGQPNTLVPCTPTQVPACILPATFDRPISAVFDPSGTTAYVLNCGPECGSTTATASVTAIDMTNTGSSAVVLSTPQPVPGATVGLLQGTQLYIAGTQLGTGGILTQLNLASGLSNVSCAAATLANCKTFPIMDGYHTGMQMGAGGQLFLGSKACSASSCLDIFDTTKLQVLTPNNSPAGDVTGITPIPNRNVVYVCLGGLLRVYDTTTDQLKIFQSPQGQPDVVGQAIDVKVVDF